MIENRGGSVRGERMANVAIVDPGLRAHMLRVYNYMIVGLIVTGLSAMFVYSLSIADDIQFAAIQNGVALQFTEGLYLTDFGRIMFSSPLRFIFMFAPLGLVLFLGARLNHMKAVTARRIFWIYSALVGMSLSAILATQPVAPAFFVTAATFGSLSLFGYTTNRDLSPWGSFFFMGLIGIICASVFNLFLASPALDFGLSVLGVLVFSGLTAYDTQAIKEMYYADDDGEVAGRKAIMGALKLYLDFINLFLMIMRLLNRRG